MRRFKPQERTGAPLCTFSNLWSKSNPIRAVLRSMMCILTTPERSKRMNGQRERLSAQPPFRSSVACRPRPEFRDRESGNDALAELRNRTSRMSSRRRVTRHRVPSRNARNLMKTNDRVTFYSTLNRGVCVPVASPGRGVALPCFPASLTPCLGITRHTMQSDFHSISLKTNDGVPKEVTHNSGGSIPAESSHSAPRRAFSVMMRRMK
jgi:hypothetical protein